ncbi:MAG: hypothetical protein ACRYFW_16660 [Janthinobacterium lividum]
MRGRIAGLAGLIVGAGAAALAAPAPSTPVAALAGRYSHHFTDRLVDGTAYPADDVAEIVPINATHAYVRFALDFANGHSCSLAGIAAASGDALVYVEPADKAVEGVGRCTLAIRRDGDRLAWTDGGSCAAYCGARGTFRTGDLPWASHRPISYLARLRTSREYRDALTEWRTGHAAP